MPVRSNRSKLFIYRIPNEKRTPVSSPSFPSMPRLYMELLENKNKVKPELRNKDHEPINSHGSPSIANSPEKPFKQSVIDKPATVKPVTTANSQPASPTSGTEFNT